jgi:DNA-binding response OmpR family regulator
MPSVVNKTDGRISRVLLCDDSPIERLALAHFLRKSGYEVDEAADGESAIESLKNREIDIVLLDLQMPDVDGFDVLNYLREHRRSLPVILLSGMPPDQIQDRMSDLTQQELPPLFIKPIDPDQLLDVLELQLRGEMPEIAHVDGDSERAPTRRAPDA